MMIHRKVCAHLAAFAVFLGLAACSRTPKDVRLIASGKQFLLKKDYGRAALQFRSAVEANPKNFEAHYQLAQAEIGLGDKVAAYRALTKALDLNPKHAGAQLGLANLLLTSNAPEDVKEAQAHAQAVLDGSPDNPNALDAMAAAELKLGNRDQALDLLERAKTNAPQHLQAWVELSLVKLGNKDTAGAQQVLEQAVEQLPDSIQARVILGAFYLMVGKLPPAEQQFRAALAKDPNHGLALFDLASVLRASGRKGEAEQIYRRLSGNPQSPYRSAYGSYLFNTGRQNEAVSEFERLAKLDSKDVNARTRLVAAYIATRRIADAQRLLDATLRKSPRDTAALLQRSELYMLAGAYQDARNDLNQILHFAPDSARAHFLLSNIERSEGKPLQQRQQLAEAVRLDPAFFAARIALAQAYLTAGDGRSALDLMNQTPPNQRALGYLEYRNWALFATGDLNELQKGITQGLAQATTRDLLLQDALLNLRLGKSAAGESRLIEILKRNPEDLGAVDVLIRSYTARNQAPAAIEKLRSLIAERPKSAALQYRLGVLLAANRQAGGARAAYTAALAIDPVFAPARLALAGLDQAEGNLDAARKDVDPLLSSKTAELAARSELGFLDAKSGQYAQAIEHLRKVVDAQPTNVIALNNLAYLLADHTGQIDEALKYAQKAKELAPNDVTVSGTLGWAYFQKGLYADALRQLKDAVNREGTNVIDGTAVRRYHLAMAYAKTGDELNAAKALQAAMTLAPNLPETRMAVQVVGGVK